MTKEAKKEILLNYFEFNKEARRILRHNFMIDGNKEHYVKMIMRTDRMYQYIRKCTSDAKIKRYTKEIESIINLELSRAEDKNISKISDYIENKLGYEICDFSIFAEIKNGETINKIAFLSSRNKAPERKEFDLEKIMEKYKNERN